MRSGGADVVDEWVFGISMAIMYPRVADGKTNGLNELEWRVEDMYRCRLSGLHKTVVANLGKSKSVPLGAPSI